MASFGQLQSDVQNWLNRQDCAPLLPSWTVMLETEIAETLRARCMVTLALQNIDAPYIALPADFAAMESIRDATTGELLELKDEWSGHWTETYARNSGWSGYGGAYYNIAPDQPCSAYRLVGNCIEFLPHPVIPDPPDPSWVPQAVQMGWYAKPRPLVNATDTNAVLENLYSVYLYGLVKIGAVWALLDDARAQQADAMFQQVVTRANLWKQGSDYSGAPFRAELACRF